MGVKDLWQLLSPIGRRVSIESLEGKTLAIDASIWITQFIKAMRDEEGKMMKNAHLIGTLRRVLRLLFHRIRPLFVFDGATPELKLRVVQARRKGREMQEESKRVAAQRLLRAQLRLHALEHSNRGSSAAPSTGTFVSSFKKREGKRGYDMEEDLGLSAKSTDVPLASDSTDAMEDVEWQDGYENLKGKQLTGSDGDGAHGSGEARDEEAEWQLPDNADDLSAEVLSSLPAHIRKSLVEDARRRQRTASRAHYLPVAGNPALYSQTQLSNFLSSSKLNKKFVEAQKSAEGPLQGSRIAADGGRKYQYLSLAARASDLSSQQDAVVVTEEAATAVESADEEEGYWEPFPPDPAQPDIVSAAHAQIADTCVATDATVDETVISEVLWEEAAEPAASPSATPPAEARADQALSVGASVAPVERPRPEPTVTYFNLADSSDEGASDVAWESGSEADGAVDGDCAGEIAHLEEFTSAEVVVKEGIEDDADGPRRQEAVSSVTRVGASRVDGVAERYAAEEFSACSVSAEAANQAILTASSMADWAGRAVRRALKDHLQRPSATAETSEARAVQPPAASPPVVRVRSENSLLQSPPPVVSDILSQQDTDVEARQEVAQSSAVGADDTSTGQSVGQDTGLAAVWIDDPIDQAEARRQFNRAMRDSESLSEELKEEVIQLLQAMNLPYLVAPFEAEAQCAVLEQLGLVDGVVTEDSDALLFGAATVYKNIFSDKKYVEVYLAEDARREMRLWREDLVAFAYFLGSDYAEGVNGVGIVNAVEIIRAFPMRAQPSDASSSSSSASSGEVRPGDDVAEGPLSGLRKFKEWLHGYDFEGEFFGKEDKAQRISSGEHQLLTEFTDRHRGARSRWTVPDSFPDPRVARAYLRPAASYSADQFTWQQAPDSATLKAFCSDRLGWTAQQIDAAIDPVLQRCSQRTVQTRIDAHFLTYQSDTRFAKIASGRLRDAVVVQVAGKRSSLSLSGNTAQRRGPKKKKLQQDDA